MSFELEHSEIDPAPPLVDVVLISYNHENFIGQAIESVLSQQTTFKFRLLIGDDCSTDNTQAIIRSYAEKNPGRISPLLEAMHRGLESPDRVGFRALLTTTAKYVAMLDGDDYWTDANKLQKQVDFLEGHPDFAICFHNARMIYQDSVREPANYVPANFRDVSLCEDLFIGNFIPTSSVVFRRALLNELPEWYPTMGIGDWPLHILNAQHGKIGYLNALMAGYRVHDRGAWSAGNFINNGLEVIRMLDKFDTYLDFRYRSQIRAARAEWYYALAETAYQQGKMDDCRSFLSKHLDQGGTWPANRRTLSLFLRARQPGVYRALRSVRDSMRSVTSQNQETTKRV
jgi:glycosyltransferase involved in cell wall biosynthesis